MNADRTLLTDELWAELSPVLPGQAESCGVTAANTRGFVEAMLWLGRTGDLAGPAGAPWPVAPGMCPVCPVAGQRHLGVGNHLSDKEQL